VRDIEVSSPSAPAQFEQTESDGKVHVKIGNPDRTVTGRQDYTVSFTVLAAATRFPDHDELYWNAIGPGWLVPIDRATVTVRGSAEIEAAACYAGPVGSRTPCASATSEGSTANYRGGPLQPGEALTIVAGWPAGSVAVAPPVLAERRTAGKFLFGNPWAAAVGPAILALGVAALVWRRHQVAAERAEVSAAVPPTVVQEHAPPDGIPPGLAGLLENEEPRPPHVAATLADLSARGYVTIEPAQPDTWRLRALRDPDASLRPWELTLLSGLFAWSSDVLLADLAALPSLIERVQDQMRADAAQRGWFRDGVGYGAPGRLALVLAVPLIFVLGFAANAGAVGLALLVAGVLLLIAAAAFQPPPLTPAGAAMRARVIGFRRWIGRLDPSRTPLDDQDATFRRLLPYAVAFGFAPRMVKVFAPTTSAAWQTPDTFYYNTISAFTHAVKRAGERRIASYTRYADSMTRAGRVRVHAGELVVQGFAVTARNARHLVDELHDHPAVDDAQEVRVEQPHDPAQRGACGRCRLGRKNLVRLTGRAGQMRGMAGREWFHHYLQGHLNDVHVATGRSPATLPRRTPTTGRGRPPARCRAVGRPIRSIRRTPASSTTKPALPSNRKDERRSGSWQQDGPASARSSTRSLRAA
jgi:hypothetical protein